MHDVDCASREHARVSKNTVNRGKVPVYVVWIELDTMTQVAEGQGEEF